MNIFIAAYAYESNNNNEKDTNTEQCEYGMNSEKKQKTNK